MSKESKILQTQQTGCRGKDSCIHFRQSCVALLMAVDEALCYRLFTLQGLLSKYHLLPITFLKSQEKKIVFPCVCVLKTRNNAFPLHLKNKFCHAITQQDSKTSQSLADTPMRGSVFKTNLDTVQNPIFMLPGQKRGHSQSRQHGKQVTHVNTCPKAFTYSLCDSVFKEKKMIFFFQ